MGGGGNGGLKRCQSAIILSKDENKTDFGELQPTLLYVGDSEERLSLPRRDTAPCSLDVYLQSIPTVADRSKRLFRRKSCLQKAALSQKCLSVLQGEVAHASTDQLDLLVSGEATTCHVVALRSTHSKSQNALASMAHVDQADVYEQCLEKMVQEHLNHHLANAAAQNLTGDDYGFFMGDDEEEEEEEEEDDFLSCQGMLDEDDQEDDHDNDSTHSPKPSFLPDPVRHVRSVPSLIHMELHIAGGYLDKDGTSQSLSTSLVHSFSKLADKYQDKLRISLSTAAISSMNSCCHDHGPKSRGLALNLHTGKVTPVTTAVPSELDGPALEVRSARMWRDHANPELAVIHTASKNGMITIDPFQYQPKPQLDALLKVPDPVLLQVTSTSPEHESERFCNDLRRTLSFVNTVPADQVFRKKQPLRYSRSSDALNQWEPVAVA
jgi:Protein N-terminal asparagine amidohydrolase